MRVAVGAVALLVLLLPFGSFDFLEIQVEEQCETKCQIKNHTEARHYQEGSQEQCEEGCRLWRSALNSSCQDVCDGIQATLSTKELYCIIGCTDAVNRYYSELTQRLGTPPPPALVADSLTATSMRLEWNFPEAREAGLRYFLQWRFEEHAGGWQYCRNQSWGPQDTAYVDNLQPYTKYKFRVALILSNLTNPIFSPPSVVISTLAEGVPASPPRIIRAVAIDSTRISVSWEPGPFPHGPILSYVLRITDNQPHGYSALKDIPAEENFYNLKDLHEGRTYNIELSMSNSAGPGPPAVVTIATPKESANRSPKDSEKPVLILGAHHIVIEQGTEIMDDPVILYNTNEFIQGIAIHVSKRLLFVSDSARYVLRMPLFKYSNRTKTTVILSPSQMNFTPLDLSMDWLNEHLYVLGEVTHQSKAWQIARSNLDGQGLTIAVAGLKIKPHHIEVDPYNGYLFWVTKIGLYRLDLADISNGIRHEVKPELILAEGNLGAFTIDHINFRLLVSDQNNNTVNAVSLDGKEVSNMREKIIKSRLQNVLSLATANNKFYWTDGQDFLYEEYHPSMDNSYFHNSYPVQLSKSYIKVLVNLTSSQPVPVPVNPPTSVQAIFGTDIAKTTWQTPHLLGGQGKGAWQNWSYEISVKDLKENNTTLIHDINSTSYTIFNLQQDTEYIIKTSAYTSFGKGPWSTEFVGRTLKKNKDGNQPVILWSSKEGLLKSDASGENVETAIHKSLMNDYFFTNVAWYEDELYLVTNTLQVWWYNMSSHKHNILTEIDSARSIAIDWIGKKLYWSNPRQQLIIRGNLNGTQQEPLPIPTLAKDLIIDSIRGYLYWSTGLAVECAHLNGADRFVYHPAEYFSGKHGLTLDMDHKFVYWIVEGLNSSNLYRAPMAGTSSQVGGKPVREKVALLQPNIKGPLCYFNNRLIWLKNNVSAIISDLRGRNMASIQGNSLLGLYMMYVMDSSHNVKPNATKLSSIEGISVIPDNIEGQSVRVAGTWDSFNITWQPVQNVNYGTIFYEIIIDNFSTNDSTTVTTFPSIQYLKNIQPYSKLYITIRAYTYWGTSTPIKVKIHSPPSTPSAPRNPRTYVSHQHNYINADEINITFRWDRPANSNGILEGYKVVWWYRKGKDVLNDSIIIDASEREHVVGDLYNNTTYYFQVQAFTEIGEGELSSIAQVNTSNESPVPTLLIASSDSIYIQDIDTNQNYSLIHGISTPIEMSYLLKERKVFWINDMQELLMFNLANSNRTKICDVNGNGISLTVDWLERSLYYVQMEDSQGSLLYKLDLNHVEKGVIKSVQIFRTPYIISKIEISPFSRKLYWVESDVDHKNYRLMQANTDGSNMTSFFSESTRSKRDSNDEDGCNCPIRPSIEKTFAIDHSDSQNRPLIVFVDLATKNIISSDKEGCKCDILVNNTLVSIPIKTLKSDIDSLYWTNKSRGLLYSVKKNSVNAVKKDQINARDILIFGQHMQPYPINKCLMPLNDQNLTISLQNRSSNSLTLKMPNFKVNPECRNVSMATVEYKVFYMPYNNEKDLQCDETYTQDTTFHKTLTIKNLRPYSKYVFCLSLSNYFMSFTKNDVDIGPGVVLQTAAGAPSHPRNVQVIVLNPNLVKVKWEAPQELNGDYVYYEIHWRTEGYISGIRQKGEQTVMNHQLPNTTNYSTILSNLTPNETYSIWVRAYSQTNETWSNSKIVKIKTFPEPDNITLVSNTAFELNVQWNVSVFVESFVLQYALLTSYDWIDLNSTRSQENNYMLLRIGDLKPKTQYKFRLNLKYPQYEEIYVWPRDARFTFETLGDRPSPPGIPIIQHVKDDIYQVWWEASKENGAPIDMYKLEALKTPNYRGKRSTNRTAWFPSAPSVEETEFDWEDIYNGTDPFWRISGLTDKYRYAFRVSALNAYGWSDYSDESIQFDPTAAAQLAEKQNMTYLIAAISVPLIIVVLLLVAIKCCKMCCTKSKKDPHVIVTSRGPDVELATLRELPRRVNFIHNTNVLYTSTQPTADELNLLPHIRRDQITLMKFLGSGAFGEVFKGKAKGLSGNSSETKVAVKTLRKGASDQEKTEFLQEAQLMSHFKHEHILQLLGVCLDNDPHFIIMELMQGGDLLTYLRSSRKPGMNTPPLNLLELLKMCVDVAKGCRYLEEMHFVHRDLACRNCLVSSTEADTRRVKIGDFGLARDIYKNDYYRKEGEGLLPVRWMAPESLVDGVFTCQSDVWAFGVLLWEIMTLGQQPYPARNNLEVLDYVRCGGRLGKPTDCPEILYELMLSCWSCDPDRRPTFKFCLDALERLNLQTANLPMTGAHMGQYISTVPQQMDGISNQAYFQDENHNNSGASWKSGSEEDSSRERTPFLQNQAPAEIPKYLELVYDSDCPVENDGYEVPRTTLSTTDRLSVTAETSDAVTTSDDPVSIDECDKFSKVVNDLTSIEYLLKDGDIGYTNMNPDQNGSVKSTEKT